jgi:O-antigen ligase
MDSSTSMAADRRTFLVLAGVFVALAPVAVYAKLGTVVLLAITLFALPGGAYAFNTFRTMRRNLLLWIGATLAVWAAITLAWTPQPDAIDVARVALMPLMGLLLMAVVRDLPQDNVDKLARLMMYAGLAMLAMLALEVFSGGAIYRFVIPDPPYIAPGQTPPVVEAAARGTAVIAPLTFVYAYLIGLRCRWVFAAAFVAAVIIVCKSSTMDAAWVAIAAGSIALAATLAAPRLAMAGFFVGLIAYALLAPVISTHLLTLDGVTDLGDRAWTGTYSRIGIWQEAARLIAERPILGHGFDATRALSAQSALIPGTSWPALPLHTHNGILQIWLELGGVGIAITVAFMAAAARTLWPLTSNRLHTALVLATLASTAVITLVSFGIWQHWWWATWMLTAASVALALRVDPVKAAQNP